MSLNFEQKSFGTDGAIYTANTSAVTAPTGKAFFAIQVLADTNFFSLTGSISPSPTGVNIPAGTVLFGIFSSYQLTSGRVIAYIE